LSLNFEQVAGNSAPVRISVFILSLLALWLPFVLPIYLWLNEDPNKATIVTMGLLFCLFLGLVHFWGKNIYNQHLFERYGLVWKRKNGVFLVKGLATGLLFTWSLFAVEALFGWVEFKASSPMLIRIVLEGLLSGLAIGLAEELLFRGWLLDELNRDYSPRGAIWIDSLVFAFLHFLKPLEEVIRTLVTFPALLLLGLTLVWAKRSHGGHLGITIGIHSGLVWGYYVLNVGQLFTYTGKVPPWVTGVDGNPIAGLMGLLFLGLLAGVMRNKYSCSSG
jgi:membrane protease YdiL (CAAX protease family)